MENSDAALYAALAKAQMKISNPQKNREVTVRSEKGAYKFAYATLDAVLECIRMPLAENGLAFSQALERTPEGMVLCLRLVHASGSSMQTCMPVDRYINNAGKIQELGSAITYARRYQISAFFGIVGEEDDDGNASDGNQRDMRDRRPASAPTPTAAPDELIAAGKKAAAQGSGAMAIWFRSLPESDRAKITPDIGKMLREIATQVDEESK